MTVDRGGLDYSILVKDQFSSNLQNFKSEVRRAKAEWAAFRNELRGSARASTQIRKDLTTTNRALAARNREITRSKRESRGFAQAIGVEAAARKEDTRATDAQNRVSGLRIRQINTETRSVRRLTRAYQQLRVARGRQLTSQIGTAPSRLPARQATPASPVSTTRSFGNLAENIDRADRSANRISFTFRRLFGILAAFTAARR